MVPERNPGRDGSLDRGTTRFESRLLGAPRCDWSRGCVWSGQATLRRHGWIWVDGKRPLGRDLGNGGADSGLIARGVDGRGKSRQFARARVLAARREPPSKV